MLGHSRVFGRERLDGISAWPKFEKEKSNRDRARPSFFTSFSAVTVHPRDVPLREPVRNTGLISTSLDIYIVLLYATNYADIGCETLRARRPAVFNTCQ